MKVFQKILSHGLLITFFVAVFFLYLYRAALFPQWFEDRAETDTASTELSSDQTRKEEPDPVVTGDQAAVSPPVSAPEPVQVPATDDPGLPPLVTEDEPVPTGGELPPLAAEGEPSSDSTPGAPAMPVNERVEPVAVEEDQVIPPVEAVPAATEQAPVAEMQTTAPVEASEPEQAEAVVTPAEPVAEAEQGVVGLPTEQPIAVADYQSQLLVARELYWKQDSEGAITAYTALLQAYPDQAAGWGELGNLYMALGQRDSAVGAYSQAIGLFIQQGNRNDALGLLGVMRSLDPVKEAEFRQRLEQAER